MRKYFLLLVAGVALLSGCATNPVTGKSELAFVPESWELGVGQQQYQPSQQMQGGEYVVDPQVVDYVAGVGQRLAAVSDRQLPYEFTVLNNSVPNAWALPGGKIAVNRGLLLELGSEAELAAVLGHEIVHAAARHGAKGMERATFTQAAMIGLALSTRDNEYAGMITQGAQLGAVLITTKYGRDAELESDYYGMQYMNRAGYDPEAAVALQQTFVRLSDGRRSDWLSGLFASHPPSASRVAANRETAAALPDGGEMGTERYQQAIAPLKKNAAAYEAYDKGVAALQGGDAAKAEGLARQALAIEPREAKFHALLGDVQMTRRRVPDAIGYYDAAVQRNPGYFRPILKRGLARESAGDLPGARADLEASVALLPTAPAYLALGNIASRSGQQGKAIEYYRVAASSDSDVGRAAAVEMVRLDLPNNPGQYIQSAPDVDSEGNVVVLLGNAAPVAIGDIDIEVILLDPTGRQIVGRHPYQLRGQIQPGQRQVVRTRLGPLTDRAQLNQVKIQVRSARVAE